LPKKKEERPESVLRLFITRVSRFARGSTVCILIRTVVDGKGKPEPNDQIRRLTMTTSITSKAALQDKENKDLEKWIEDTFSSELDAHEGDRDQGRPCDEQSARAQEAWKEDMDMFSPGWEEWL
jgi:hypothetical protein